MAAARSKALRRAAAFALILAVAGCSADPQPQPARSSKDVATTEADATGWPSYGGQSSSTKYSALDQINRSNVARLKLAWTWHSGEMADGSDPAVESTVSEMTPIYANGHLYGCTPFGRIVAIDPATGREKWSFDPKKPRSGNMYRQNYCRGVAYWQAADPAAQTRECGRRIIYAGQNAQLMAVDANRGTACTGFGTGGKVDLAALDYKGEGKPANTSPPAVWGNVIVVGVAVQDNMFRNALDGIVRGFDVVSGRELWSWNPIPDDLSPVTGAANAWAPLSIDAKRGWVFVPTGSASWDTLGVNRIGRIPDANAVVALDMRTGRKVWSYQTVHHDLWDYDLPSAPTLATIDHAGRATEAVIQGTKTGNIFVLDRKTGKPLFPVVERTVPQSDMPGETAALTQPMPTLPRPVTSQAISAKDAWGMAWFDRRHCEKRMTTLRNEGLFTPPSTKGSVLHPSFLGGTNWGGIAYDPGSGLAVVNSSNLVASVTLKPRAEYVESRDKRPGVSVYEMQGSPYVMLREVLMSPLGAPCNPPPWGQLTAIDMRTGQTRWQVPFGQVKLPSGVISPPEWGAPNQGGPIVTRGGLVFIGASLDSRFRAYDIQTGREVWSVAVPAPATATPMTFRHSDGRQYVVISAGGHGGFGTRLGDAMVAYALPAQ
ncbi:pyrroloquinoline quinone-dependent dehydrogenase [Novosphingobium sp.]|uniref:pyrroloquinoline quinone-dependent dehydrogenase n=1 Tax=Novosphingobium sp. TaxID=1874826 RepID=UPI00262673B1|nr:pyrroloquinoline quinone-dependent dehydrogenase [Novosphingobium sp.]